MLKPLTDELISAAEAGRFKKFVEKLKEAKLPEKVIKEVASDCKEYPAVARRNLELSSPELGAKWLNKTGISAEHRHEVAFVTGLALIFGQGRSINAKLDALIETAKEQNEKPKA